MCSPARLIFNGVYTTCSLLITTHILVAIFNNKILLLLCGIELTCWGLIFYSALKSWASFIIFVPLYHHQLMPKNLFPDTGWCITKWWRLGS